MKIGIQLKETTDGLWVARRKNCFGKWKYFSSEHFWVNEYESVTLCSTKRILVNIMNNRFPMPKRKTFLLKDSK